MNQFILVIRGVSGSGKTTLAKNLQSTVGKKVAHLRADYFYWKVSPQDEDKDTDNNPIVYENLADLAENYLEHGYSVIVEGLLSQIDKFGLQKKLDELSRKHNIKLVRILLDLELEKAHERNMQKDFPITEDQTRYYYKQVHKSLSKKDIIVDTNQASEETLLEKVTSLLS